MKDNIDLTRNRMFPQLVVRESKLWRVLTRIPWKLHPITSDSELAEVQLRFFPTGNREERKRMRKAMLEESGVYCDRCGTRIVRIPWDNRYYGLCKKCEEAVFEPRQKQIPWKHSDKEETDGNKFF